MTKIDFSGHRLTLSPEGALYWPAESMLVVSDLCLEKEGPCAMRGRFLPSSDTRETLERLERAVAMSGASRILFLGDSFLDADGPDRLGLAERDCLEDICGALQAIWVQRNNGGGWVPPRARPCEVFALGGLTFRHEASRHGHGEISGHFHPCVEMPDAGGIAHSRCFIEDGRKMVMPSFGAFTGGLDVREPAIAAHFPGGFTVHVLGMEKIHTLPTERLVA